jgi:hypothetical protein
MTGLNMATLTGIEFVKKNEKPNEIGAFLTVEMSFWGRKRNVGLQSFATRGRPRCRAAAAHSLMINL